MPEKVPFNLDIFENTPEPGPVDMNTWGLDTNTWGSDMNTWISDMNTWISDMKIPPVHELTV